MDLSNKPEIFFEKFDAKDFFEKSFYMNTESKSEVIYHINPQAFSSRDSASVFTNSTSKHEDNSNTFLQTITPNPYNTSSAIFDSPLPPVPTLDSLKAKSILDDSQKQFFKFNYSGVFTYRFLYNTRTSFPWMWGLLGSLLGAVVLMLIVAGYICSTFKKKTEFLKINKKAAQNLDSGSEPEEENEPLGEIQGNLWLLVSHTCNKMIILD